MIKTKDLVETVDSFINDASAITGEQKAAWKLLKIKLLMKDKYPKFKDFWDKVGYKGDNVFMNLDDLKSWSENVFKISRIKSL